MTNEPNPNKQIEIVIKDSELPSLAKDYAEIAIDGIMDDGILKDFPLVGSVVGFIKFGSSLNKHFASKKIYKFLYQLNTISEEKRIKKIDEINNSKKYQSNVGEMILELLENIESDYKPEIIGRLFKAVIEEEIDYNTYLRLADIVKNSFYQDLFWFYNQYQDGVYDKQIKINTSSPILQTGLMIDDILNGNAIFPVEDGEGTETMRKPSKLGITLIEFGMN